MTKYELAIQDLMEQENITIILKKAYEVSENEAWETVNLILTTIGYTKQTCTNVRRNSHFAKDGTFVFENDLEKSNNVFCGNEKPEHKSGVYLLGQTNFNPYNNEQHYWIKTGKATDVAKRISEYATHTPMVFKIDYYYCDKIYIGVNEDWCHRVLKRIAKGKAQGSKEWFEVDRETYLEICEKKFEFFNIRY